MLFLGKDNNVRNSIKKFAKRVGIKILTMPYILNSFNLYDLNWGDIRDFDADPAEFVKLIFDAQLRLTDFYHAMVFSMIFHKLFYLFERPTMVKGETMNMRITDFLKEYGLERQLIKPEDLLGKNQSKI